MEDYHEDLVSPRKQDEDLWKDIIAWSITRKKMAKKMNSMWKVLYVSLLILLALGQKDYQ